jgi:hypothetical protein
MVVKDETDFEIVWNGGPLLPPRDQNPDHTWTAPNRKYKPRKKMTPDAGAENNNAGNSN